MDLSCKGGIYVWTCYNNIFYARDNVVGSLFDFVPVMFFTIRYNRVVGGIILDTQKKNKGIKLIEKLIKYEGEFGYLISLVSPKEVINKLYCMIKEMIKEEEHTNTKLIHYRLIQVFCISLKFLCVSTPEFQSYDEDVSEETLMKNILNEMVTELKESEFSVNNEDILEEVTNLTKDIISIFYSKEKFCEIGNKEIEKKFKELTCFALSAIIFLESRRKEE